MGQVGTGQNLHGVSFPFKCPAQHSSTALNRRALSESFPYHATHNRPVSLHPFPAVAWEIRISSSIFVVQKWQKVIQAVQRRSSRSYPSLSNLPRFTSGNSFDSQMLISKLSMVPQNWHIQNRHLMQRRTYKPPPSIYPSPSHPYFIIISTLTNIRKPSDVSELTNAHINVHQRCFDS